MLVLLLLGKKMMCVFVQDHVPLAWMLFTATYIQDMDFSPVNECFRWLPQFHSLQFNANDATDENEGKKKKFIRQVYTWEWITFHSQLKS